MKKENEPAFPHVKQYIYPDIVSKITDGGMTKREYFAAMAMQGLLANSRSISAEGMACEAIVFADAVLAELSKAKE